MYPHNQPRGHTPESFQQPRGKSSMDVVRDFLAAQAKHNETFASTLQQLTSHQKHMDTQISQLSQSINNLAKTHNTLPGQPEANPKGHLNAVTLRSGKVLEEMNQVPEAKKAMNEEEKIVESSDKEKAIDEVVICDEEENVKTSNTPEESQTYYPSIPFPQRLAKEKLEQRYGKFLDLLKTLHINIPFLEAISEIPSYAKFFKDILSNKRRLEPKVVALSRECSAILQQKLPPKMQDPGDFSIPCSIGDVSIQRALCDLGASVSLMPLSICKKINMGELKSTIISLQLAVRSVCYPLGIL
mgnify:FL=1